MSSNERVVEAPSKMLVDACAFYVETQNDHWKESGPMFNTLFETQYTDV